MNMGSNESIAMLTTNITRNIIYSSTLSDKQKISGMLNKVDYTLRALAK
jgi:hypothetical protein